MRKYISFAIAASAALMAASSLSAQNLNPTVQVSRTYEGKLIEITKPEMVMNVPDSLLKINVDFDYEVFETPYQGAYEFRPYMLDMKPQPDAYSGRNLYVRAGAGYLFNPELTAVYSPSLKGRFQMSVYGDHKGFFGKYRDIVPQTQPYGTYLAARKDDKIKGHDMLNRLGVSTRTDWDRTILTFGVGYYGISAKHFVGHNAYNGADINLRVRSNENRSAYFLYDAAVDYRVGTAKYAQNKLNENVFVFDGSFGPVINSYNRLVVDIDAQIASYAKGFTSNVGSLSIAPKYQFDYRRWKLSLGARLGSIIRGNAEGSLLANHAQKSQGFYPEAYVGYEAAYERLVLFSTLTGGDNINSYSSILAKNHFFNPSFANKDGVLLDNTIERINVALGLKGNFAGRFQYQVKGGFSMIDNGLLESALQMPLFTGSSGRMFMPTVSYGDYNMLYTDAMFAWNPGAFTIDGNIMYKHTNLDKKRVSAFEPAKLLADLRVMYNYHDRIRGGVFAEYASARNGYGLTTTEGAVVKVPGYLDLGLLAEYQFNRKLSFYLQGGNLLNANIQRNALFIESGINFTAGVCLNF